MNRLLLLLLCNLIFTIAYGSDDLNFYVAKSGNDNNDGTLTKPFATILRAKIAVRKVKNKTQYKSITVFIRGGKYLLDVPLYFSKEDSGEAECPVVYRNYGAEKVIVSSEKMVKLKWLRGNNKTIWRASLKETGIDLRFFRNLFLNGTKLTKASTGLLKTTNFPNSSIIKYNFSQSQDLKLSNPELFFTLKFKPEDLQRSFFNDQNLEVIVYHSWEASYHNIAKANFHSNLLYLTNPFRYPIGFFGGNEFYRIENSISNLSASKQWCLDKQNNLLYFYNNRGVDPNQQVFSVPTLTKLIIINGSLGNPVKNISFKGIQFSFTNGEWGKNDIYGFNLNDLSHKYNWIDLSKGFSSSQLAPDSGESILLEYAENIIFQNCTFFNLGSYAVRIGKYSNHNSIKGCDFFDNGGGGIIIGFNHKNPISSKLDIKSSPSYNNVINNTIHNCGLVYYASVGIGVMQSNNNNISYNKIWNLPYSGISSGWTWGDYESFTFENYISYNEVFNVMQLLTDGAGIYTLGIQRNTSIVNNYIHDIKRSKLAVGANANAFFLDEGSSGITIDSNVIERIENEDLRFNKSSPKSNVIKRNVLKDSLYTSDLKNVLLHNFKNRKNGY